MSIRNYLDKIRPNFREGGKPVSYTHLTLPTT